MFGFYGAIFPVPHVFNNITACYFPQNELGWLSIYYKVEYASIRVFSPFLLMIVSSIMVTYKVCKLKTRLNQNLDLERERQMCISLISYDVFFIVFRIPMVISIQSSIVIQLHSSFHLLIAFV